MQFKGFVGNADVKEQLSSLVDSGRMPHALLIEGPSGSGRRTLARIAAQAAVCSHPDRAARPCGICSHCIKAQAGTHPDISFFGGSERARSFSIKTVRELREEGYRRPNEAECRVFVLINAQAMGTEAQDALLRIIEEPPKHLRFILTCQSRFQLLETIRSRTFALAVKGVTEAEAMPLLQQKFPSSDEQDLQTLVRLYGGCLGQIEQALEDGKWKDGLQLAPRIADALLAPGEMPLLKETSALPKDPVLVAGVLRELRFLFRDALAVKCGQQERLAPSPETADKLAAALTAQHLVTLIDTVAALETMQRYNINHSLFTTEMCARLRTAIGR